MQRALCDGVTESGVSVAYTVLKCDAGPVLAQKKVSEDDLRCVSSCVLLCCVCLCTCARSHLSHSNPFVYLSIMLHKLLSSPTPQITVDPDIQAPDLLQHLFDLGATLLLDSLPAVFQGKGLEVSHPQDEQHISHAAKVG